MTKELPVRVLFVCVANVCRSPAAEAVMNVQLNKKNLTDFIECDSVGTMVYNRGEPADHRVRNLGKKRGYEVESKTRRFDEVADFMAYDYIFVMDDAVYNDLKQLANEDIYDKKIFHITDFCCKKGTEKNLLDPYAKGKEDFESLFDILEVAIDGIIKKIVKENNF